MDSSSISLTVSYEVQDMSSSTDDGTSSSYDNLEDSRAPSSVEDNFAETNTAKKEYVDDASSKTKKDNFTDTPAPKATVKEYVDDASSKPKNKPEVEMIKERFARLLLGEDMSGSGKGVSTALALSNAITNLSVSIFGNHWRLEPLDLNRKEMWKREMDVLLAVTDHIVLLVPTWQSSPNGTNVEIMVAKPRPDLHLNLPALRKLDTMLLESLDGFQSTEFWYVEQEHLVCCRDVETNRPLKHEEKWWLPVPKVPHTGLSDKSKKALQQLKESTSQIFKAARAINAQVLSEMEVPDVYLESLPKNAKLVPGDISRYLTADPEAVLSTLDSSNEFNVLKLVNRLEACIHIWHHKLQNKQQHPKDAMFNAKASWDIVKELVGSERKEILVEKAERFLASLRHKFPGLPQSSLDMQKIQYNKDVGQSILESYSRVLESLAFNIIGRIDAVLNADNSSCCCSSSSDHETTTTTLTRSPSFANTTSLSSASCSSTSTAESILTRDTSRRQKALVPFFSPGRTLADYMRLDPFTKKIYTTPAHACELGNRT